MSTAWEWSTLGDEVVIEIGRTPSRSNGTLWDPTRTSGNVWLSIADLTSCDGRVIDDSKEYISAAGAAASKLVCEGILLMSFKLSIGKLAFAGTNLYTNEAIAALNVRSPKRLCPEFLYHYLSSVDWTALSAGSEKVKGATLNKAKLSVVPVPVPSLAEQRRIVAKLDSMDDHTSKLEDATVEVASRWTDLYDAVCRRAFAPKAGWKTVVLPDISENLDGTRRPVTRADRKPGPYPYYGASGVVDHVAGYLFDEDLLLVSEDGANLLARSTPIAFTASGKYWVNNHAHVLRFANPSLHAYVEAYLNSIPIDEWVTGAAQPKLNQGALNRIPIPVPGSDAEIEAVLRQLKAAHEVSTLGKGIAERRRSRTRDLRQSVLEAAFRGEL